MSENQALIDDRDTNLAPKDFDPKIHLYNLEDGLRNSSLLQQEGMKDLKQNFEKLIELYRAFDD